MPTDMVGIVLALLGLGVLYLMAFWFDKPWHFPLLSLQRRQELARERVEIIEGTRENWDWWIKMRGSVAMDLENRELERLRKFISDGKF